MEDIYVLSFENKEHHFEELHLNFCGRSICHPGHHIGPAAHPGYVLHYILNGKGMSQVDGRTYHLHKDQGFLMEPDVMSSYEADLSDPWEYLWIGFEGSKAKDLLCEIGLGSQALTFDATCGEQLLCYINHILNCDLTGIQQELFLQGQLFHFLSCLSHEFSTRPNYFQHDKQNYYVRAAEEFIRAHFSEDIKVQDIADAIGISRSYLTILFQNILHSSPSDYLADFRITRAHEQLRITDIPVTKISENVGYQNPLVFTRAFKKKIGLTPSQYRKAIREEQRISIEKIRRKK